MSFFFVVFLFFPGRPVRFRRPTSPFPLHLSMLHDDDDDDDGWPRCVVFIKFLFLSKRHFYFGLGLAWRLLLLLSKSSSVFKSLPPPHQKSSATERTLQRNITHTQSAPPFGAAAPHPFLGRTANPFLSFSWFHWRMERTKTQPMCVCTFERWGYRVYFL